MKREFEQVTPAEIEKRSFEIIESELPHPLNPELAPIIKRVIHTTADFEYAESLCFSPNVIGKALDAIRRGACIVTDTNMGKAGINKKALARHGGKCSASWRTRMWPGRRKRTEPPVQWRPWTKPVPSGAP